MPAKSKSQLRYMGAVASGQIKNSGLTPSQAREYISHNQGNMAYKNLPEKLPKIRKMMRGGKV